MDRGRIISRGLLQAVLAVAYIAIVASVMVRGETLFGKVQSTLSVVGFLLLFVVSAAVMGITVFGRPLIWYLDGRKKEALMLALSTIVFLAVSAVAVLCFLALRA